jgi:SAM-dependent methyltransferase
MSTTPRENSERGQSNAEAMYLDGRYLAANADWHEADAGWKANQVLRLLDRHQIRPESVCDVGCGTGAVLRHLAQAVAADTRLVGYEPSPDAFALATQDPDPRLELLCAGVEDVSGPFDLLMALDVMEHVDDALGFLRCARTKASRFVFHVPLDMSVQAVLRVHPILETRRLLGHLHYYSKETALATIRDAGFDVLDYEYTKSGVEGPSLSARGRRSGLVRRIAFRIAPDLAVRLLGGYSLIVLAAALPD